jgi:alpha-1,2-mannosyltransferase
MPSISCYVGVVVVCARRLRMNLAIVAVIGLAGLTFEPFLGTILLGKINLVLLALVVVDCPVVPARYWGMLIGFATGIKILPSAFILFLLLKWEWEAFGRAAVVFAGTVGVGAVFAPHDSWDVLEGGIHQTCAASPPEAITGGDNQSLGAVFMRLSHDISPSSILAALDVSGRHDAGPGRRQAPD